VKDQVSHPYVITTSTILTLKFHVHFNILYYYLIIYIKLRALDYIFSHFYSSSVSVTPCPCLINIFYQ
jgi:hypothetical protein